MAWNWLRRAFNREPKEGDEGITDESAIKEAGSVEGAHHTSYVETIKQLKRERRHAEAIDWLLSLIQATEREAQERQARGLESGGVNPWYYEQLAIIYRKEERYDDEVAVLTRYQAQPQAPSALQEKLAKRLQRARTLANHEKAADSRQATTESSDRAYQMEDK